MYCRECGTQINNNAEVCMNCGVRPLDSTNYCQGCGTATIASQNHCNHCGATLVKRVSSGEDTPSTLLNLVACCFPIVGIILYFVWKDEKPLSAKSVCNWAIIGLVISLSLYIVGIVLGVLSEIIIFY